MDEIQLEAAEIYHLRMRLRHPFQTSFGVEFERECILVKLGAGDHAGWGECVAGAKPGYSYETAETAWHVLTDYFLPSLAKYPLQNPGQLREALKGFKGHPLARAGLEMALWDLYGRQTGRSLFQLLGGERDRVPVGVSIGIQPDLPKMLGKIGDYLEQGYQRIKVKIKPGVDLEIVAGIREEFPDLNLQVDANSAYGLADTAHLKEFDAHRLVMLEQPFAEDDILDHAQLQRELDTPLCLDESILSVRHARQAIEAEACKIINIKPGRVGGLREAREIHDYAQSQDVPVWCGGMLETNVGRASNLAIASLPNFRLHGDISASNRYYEVDIASPEFRLNPDSTIDVPKKPGLGVEINKIALEQVTLKKARWAKFGASSKR